MWDFLFAQLEQVDDFLWGWVGFPAVIVVGIILTLRSRAVQIRRFPDVVRTFWYFLRHSGSDTTGIHPLKAFFACIGGCVGIGNIVAITSAVQIGGPGALFWIWMTAIAGSLVKYGEVYLGISRRVAQAEGGYRGGPMYFLAECTSIPFLKRWLPRLFCLLLCVYGVEIYQFSVVTASMGESLGINNVIAAVVLLLLVIYAERGGISRIGSINGVMIPTFIVIYLAMGAYVLLMNLSILPDVIKTIFFSAWSPHAAVGGFAGATIMATISQGIRRGCYSSDIGVGYASIIYSESTARRAQDQASLVIFEVFLDTFVICTMSVLLVVVTGVWQEDVPTLQLVQSALGRYFPHMDFFMPFFLFLLGYSTVITYFCAGMRTAAYLSPKWGRPIYYIYGICALFAFSFVAMNHALIVMSIVGLFLLTLNLFAVVRLRHEISYDFTNHWEEQQGEEPRIAKSVPVVIENSHN